MGIIKFNDTPAALKWTRKYQAQDIELAPLVPMVSGRPDQLTTGLKNIVGTLEMGGVLDDYALTLWFPGDSHVIARSIVEAGMTGEPLFESIFDAPHFLAAERKKGEAERVASEKLQRAQAQEARIRRLAEEQRRQEQELAERLGITPERLAQLQGQWREGLGKST